MATDGAPNAVSLFLSSGTAVSSAASCGPHLCTCPIHPPQFALICLPSVVLMRRVDLSVVLVCCVGNPLLNLAVQFVVTSRGDLKELLLC